MSVKPTYISVSLMGGLGNQLFQIFTTMAYSFRHRIPFVFEYSDLLTTGKHRPTYWNNFLKNLKVFTRKYVLDFALYNEKSFNYNELLPPYKLNFNNIGVKLHGYYQSYKYFQDEYENIIRLIGLRNIQKYIKDKYRELYFSNNKINISMHFRLGDYKNNPAYHHIMTTEYYINSLNNILNKLTDTNNIQILYFCEAEDNNIVTNTINKIKENINIQFIKVDDDINDWEQLIIMSCCDHNIIANSSFSWWGAYFNDNTNKLICYPSIWFGPACSHNTSDLCPSEWIKIPI